MGQECECIKLGEVSSAMLQEFLFRQVLFTIFMNGVEGRLSSTLTVFTDDTELREVVNISKDRHRTQGPRDIRS